MCEVWGRGRQYVGVIPYELGLNCAVLNIGYVFYPQFLKFVNLRKHHSLEFAMWFLFAFGPYFLAEGLKLSGIMAVLFCGIVMSHYTHFNLSPVTQVTVQQILRSVAFMAGTIVKR